MLKNAILRVFRSTITLAFLCIGSVPLHAQWVQRGADIDGESANDRSGYVVSMNSTGSQVAIGVWTALHAGHVRVYQWNGSAWVQKGADIDGEAVGDYSGLAISLSADGSTLASGARWNDDGGVNAGHVRVYQWNGSAWVQKGADIDGEAAYDNSGNSVSLSADGSIVAIGALGNDGNGINAGHVRVYQWDGSAWVQQGADIDGEAAYDNSGHTVSLSADGSGLAIGATGNDGNGYNSGHVRVYQWDGSAWVQQGADIDGEAVNDESSSLHMSADGTTLAIGKRHNDGNGISSGHVRVYRWNGSAWVQQGADIDGEAADDRSGRSVALSSDGFTLAVGAPRNDGNGSDSGHVRVFQWNGSAWVQQGVDIDGELAGDHSGIGVGLSSDGSIVATGALYNDGSATDAGQVRMYVYAVPATLTTTPATSITTTSATLGGDIVADGGVAITERGIVYAPSSVNNDPEIGGSGVVKVTHSTATTGSYSELISGLTTGVAYSFKAYAINFAGTSYGAVETFTTPHPNVTLSQSNPTIAEASGINTLTATLSAVSTENVTVTLGIKAGSTATLTDDFTFVAPTIVINAGDLTGTATLTAVQDSKDEEDEENITIEIISVANGSEMGAQEVTSKIIDDDDPPTVSLTVGSNSILEAAGTSSITATLSAVSGRDVTVTLGYTGTAINGTDYNNSASTSITITAGTLSANAMTGITTIDDLVPEANETIIIEIVGVTNGSENGTQQQTVTITNDDIPSVQFSTTASSGAESVNTANLQVDISMASTLIVTVEYAVSGDATAGTDYILAAGTLTFNPGEVNKNITIANIVDDAILEADETVAVTLSSPSNAILGANTTHTYTINNNDNASVTIADISGNEDDGPITVTALLDNAVQGGFTVDVNTADGTATTADGDYSAVTGQTLTFAGTAGETQTFVVSPTTDGKVEVDEVLSVSLSSLGATTFVIDISDGALVTVINDDNTPVITAGQSFNIPENLTNSSSVGTVIATDIDAGTTFQSWVILSGNDDVDNDMIAPFTINASTGQITVSDSGDLDFESGTTSFTLSVTVSDGANTSVAETVLVNVNDVNDIIPVITAGQSFTIDENLANTTSVGIIAATDGDVTATTFNNWLITSGNDQGVFAINASTGEITIADNSNLDRENSADFTLTLTVDDGVNTSAGETVLISVNDVNDVSPVIAVSQSFEVNENADNATVLGAIVASDMDVTAATVGDWTIVNGNDDNIFGIDAGSGQLSVIDNTLLNYEATASYTLGITVSDGVNTSLVENVLINVMDANERPSISGLTNIAFDEDGLGTINFTVADPDTDLADLQFSFNIDHNTVFDGSGITVSGNGLNRILTLTPKANQFGMTILEVIVSDGELSSTEQVTITVNAVNDAPTALNLSNQSIREDVAVGFEVGTLTTTDADVGDIHTYSLVSGSGDTDNEAFTISGDDLLTNAPLDFEEGETRTIRLRTTDGSGDFIEESFVITLEANPALELVIKTAFTPNGDGVNDTWIIDNIRLHPNARVSILNREGSEVFNSVGYNEPWNGTYKGKDLPQDTYYYIIDLNGNRKYKGFVTILK
ncbi:cadherin domain-containing protein [Fulvivirgaceae bacterium BMA12]|uniref:Cadherin domain-containing protein n=1 Tax=Agaribacillus aureus TaxID=3051825 RepID=A0ABT8L5H1_9BACT|nr:cadherin domain-containing protein [Fulvivirgaceae bacterium BMA12]